MNRIISMLQQLFCVLFMGFFLVACHQAQRDEHTLYVGTISGPETELMKVAQHIAQEKYHLNLKIIEFSDYALPNAALHDGSLDINVFQHQLFLDHENEMKHYQLVMFGKTFLYPMGIYSRKINHLKDVQDNAIVAIPNDVSNEARALLLLNKAGLITLKPSKSAIVGLADIINNPKHLQFKELDASQLARVLPDVTLSVINTNYAIPAGLYPNKDAIFLEDKTSPYVNVMVTRKELLHDPRLTQFMQAFQSQAVEQKAKELFDGQAIRGW